MSQPVKSDPEPDRLEEILRQCAAAAPEPWYPSAYAQATGIPRDNLDAPLDRLRLGGLVRLTDWIQGRGQGYALTPEGQQVLESPRDLARLHAGKLDRPPASAPLLPDALRRPGSAWDRGEAVRAALLYPSPPRVTQLLLFANIAWFLIGLAYAVREQVPANEFLAGSNTPGVMKVLYQMGALSGEPIVQGGWGWLRLLSTCFVHIGLLHLGVNMYSLWVLGRVEESLWGHVRFLLLYLLAGLGGSCAMLMNNPLTLGAGASGALFGLMAALAVWTVLSRRYIGQLASVWLRQLLIVFILNIGISTLPRISASAHFGGALAGLLAAVLLYEQRFGAGGVQRVLAAAGLVALPVFCIGLLLRAEKQDPRWEALDWNYRRLPFFLGEGKAADQIDRDEIEPLRRQKLKALSPEEVQKALAAGREERSHLEKAAAYLREIGSYQMEEPEDRRKMALGRVEQAIRDSCKAELQQFCGPLASDAEREARRAYASAGPLLDLNPIARDADAVQDVIARLGEGQARLTEAAGLFQEAGPYPDEALDKDRKADAHKLEAEARLLELAARRLRQGRQWTREDEEAFKQQLQRLKMTR